MARTGKSSKSFWVIVGIAFALLAVGPRDDRADRTSVHHWLTPFLQLLQGQPVDATYFPTPIKSITAISLTNAAPTQTVSVTASASILIYNGLLTNEGGTPRGLSYATITNGTTITLATPVAGSSTWKGTLVEFFGNFVKSQHCGTITIAAGATSATETIVSVNQAKTMLAFTGETVSVNGSGNNNSAFATLTPTNATTLTANVDTAVIPATSVIVGECLLEFK